MFPGKQYLLLQGIETLPLKLVLEIFCLVADFPTASDIAYCLRPSEQCVLNMTGYLASSCKAKCWRMHVLTERQVLAGSEYSLEKTGNFTVHESTVPFNKKA